MPQSAITGFQTRTERMRMNLLTKLSTVTGMLGAGCATVAAFSPSYITDEGFVVEPFAWMAASRILLVLAAIGLAMSLLLWGARRVGAVRTKKPGI